MGHLQHDVFMKGRNLTPASFRGVRLTGPVHRYAFCPYAFLFFFFSELLPGLVLELEISLGGLPLNGVLHGCEQAGRLGKRELELAAISRSR